MVSRWRTELQIEVLCEERSGRFVASNDHNESVNVASKIDLYTRFARVATADPLLSLESSEIQRQVFE